MKIRISGVIITDLRVLTDERGAVLHMMRCDSPSFRGFGEIYFSKVFCGAIKAWKQHQRMTLNIAVPVGEIKLVLYDDRPTSETRGALQELTLSETNYSLVTIPPLVWLGFMGLAQGASLLANLASIAHCPSEVSTLDPFAQAIPYRWQPVS